LNAVLSETKKLEEQRTELKDEIKRLEEEKLKFLER